jgi:hypothetical protein
MTDGGVLRTIGDAISYMTALPKQRELQQTWQHACRLILILDGAPIEAITRQLSLALFMDAKLDIGRKLIRAKREDESTCEMCPLSRYRMGVRDA